MKLASILSEELIFFNVKGVNREDIYRNMLEQGVGEIEQELDIEDTVKAIMDREDTTGMIYDSVAMPHLRMDKLEDLFILIGILDTPVKIMPNDLVASKIVIMSLISPTTSDLYLKSIAAFSKFFRNTENLDKLAETKDAESFKEFLHVNNVKLKKDITAEDLMTYDSLKVSPTAPLSVALDIFNREKVTILPVVDDSNHLLGVIEANTVIKKFIPEYIFMMDHLNFLNSFEAFDKIFKEENVETVDKFMLKPKYTCGIDTPLIQITIEILKSNIRKVFVIDSDNKLIGEVSVQNIIHKVLRG